MELSNPIILLFISLVGALIPLVLPDKIRITAAWLSITFQLLGFATSIAVCSDAWPSPVVLSFNWMEIANTQINFSVSVDRIAALLLVIVSFISLLVQVFSLEYMKKDDGFKRYYSLLSFFTFSMIGIVISSNLLIVFMFWELVGFSSYLLIGFWYNKNSAAIAAKKAFVVNRIGDVGFIVALSICWSYFHSFDLDVIDGALGNASNIVITVLGLSFFIGAMGKSAQFPLQVWLPDAMEGPTPVSALIHAATMVAAGVYLMVRLFFLLTPEVLLFIGIVGGITAFIGAVAALYQNDIKKVLAFSTISQLGYMMVGIGTGSYEAATFHLFTHAFFKAGLFLGAGSIIHSLHQSTDHDFDAQDMNNMGGLKSKLPITYFTYLIFSLSLIGLPLFSGFLSKEAILSSAVHASTTMGGLYWLVTALVFASILFTAFYVVRMILMVFYGSHRSQNIELVRESLFQFKLVLILLALGSLFLLWSFNPFSPSTSWLIASINPNVGVHTSLLIPITSIALILIGSGMAFIKYKNYQEASEHGPIVQLSRNSWYIDVFYQKIIIDPFVTLANFVTIIEQKVVDRFVNLLGIGTVVLSFVVAWFDRTFVDGSVNFSAYLAGRTGALTRSVQGGKVQTYILLAIIGLLIIIILAL